ncbi:carbon-nitrogen hydrolase family protein [Nonomuraea sp. NPDC005650]|uniref:carbon-nitrogen hydrolase family protein n=1 Tax=Nonomuraea sp. NPDC005650 TaxID=3157045 RepID=UPI0033A1D740
MRTIRACVVQSAVTLFDRDANRERALRAADEALSTGADLVVLPELANAGFLECGDVDRHVRFSEQAETAAGPFVSGLREVAAGRGHVAAGFLEQGAPPTGRLFNSLALTCPDGTLHVYRKTHLPRNEKLLFTRGNELQPVETELGAVGLLVCADNSFPEAARTLALRGCEVLVVSLAAGRLPNPSLYSSIAVTRAYENQVYVVSANQAGPSETGVFAGNSTIAAPDGTLLAELDEAEGSAHAVLDPELLRRERLRQTRYADRRADLYGPLAAT